MTWASGYIYSRHVRQYWDFIYEIFEDEKHLMNQEEKQEFWDQARKMQYWEEVFPVTGT